MYFMLRDQDNAIIRPLPKIKRMVGDSACLPHIVQVSVDFHFFCLPTDVILLLTAGENQIFSVLFFAFPAAFDF